MAYFRFLAAGIIAVLAGIGTYASLYTTDFGSLAVVPAFFVMIVVFAPFTPRFG